MTANLDHLVENVRAKAKAEAEAWWQHQRENLEAKIREEAIHFQTALKQHLGKEIVQALREADGAIEVWKPVSKPWTYEVFTLEQPWKGEEFPKIYIVLAFTYRGCRFHLRYRAPEHLNLARVEVHGQTCSLIKEQAMWATDRQYFLHTIDKLAR